MMVDEAFTLQLVYNNLNSALSIVHKAIAHTQPISHKRLLQEHNNVQATR